MDVRDILLTSAANLTSRYLAACTGVRVPHTTHAPKILPGVRSTSGDWLQSIQATFSRSFYPDNTFG